MKKTTAILLAALFALTGFNASAQTQEAKDCQGKCPTPAGQMNKMRQPREFTEFAFEGILLDINQQTRIDSLNAAVKANAPQASECTAGKCGKCGPECTSPENCPNKADCQKADCPKGKKACADKADCPKDKKACADKADCPKGKKACADKADCPKDKKACADKADCPKAGKVKGSGVDPRFDGGIHSMKQRPASPYGPEYIEKVKEILTPEQYTVFLENIVEYQANRPAGMRGHAPNGNCQNHNGKHMPKSPNARCTQGQD